ncbi:hypothetical protein Ga0100231_008135 [Opitutaceae bacterium TAV4]|nr:hypothetical protein Ga0100231_008135 [Opitutaceae bacterium TAV4]RRJ98422.1 hypothetical protein Ga0100230_008435 [Opitutaceae bacterium TAV3]
MNADETPVPSDDRVRYPAAIEARDALKQLCQRLTTRMQTTGFDGMPTDDEWGEIHRLVHRIVTELQIQTITGDYVEWKNFRQVESRYPDVHLRKLTDRIVKMLKTKAAPVDKLRIQFWPDIQKARREQLSDLDCDVGLVQWVLERGQWEPEAQGQELSPDQWKKLDEILRPFVQRAENPVSRLDQARASYKELSDARAEGGRRCLRGLIRSADRCRKLVGEAFSLQLHWLWSLNSDDLQRELRRMGHIRGGRARYNRPEKLGKFLEEGRPPSRQDQKAQRKQRKTRERVRNHRNLKK